MKGFVSFLQSFQDVQGIRGGRLADVYALEPAGEGAVFFEMVAEFLVRRGTDAAQFSVGEHGLQQVRGVHGPAASRPCAHKGMYLVDDEDAAGLFLQLLDHRLDAGFKVAAVSGAGKYRTHVQGIDGAVFERFGHAPFVDRQRDAFRDGCFAGTRLSDQHRVVFAAPGKDFERAGDLAVAPDERVDASQARLFDEIDCKVGKRRFLRAAFVFVVFFVFAAAAARSGYHAAHVLDDDAASVVVLRAFMAAYPIAEFFARHVLLLQKMHGPAIRFVKHGIHDVSHFGAVPPCFLGVEQGVFDAAGDRRALVDLSQRRAALGQAGIEVLVKLRAQPRDVGPAFGKHGASRTVKGDGKQDVL